MGDLCLNRSVLVLIIRLILSRSSVGLLNRSSSSACVLLRSAVIIRCDFSISDFSAVSFPFCFSFRSSLLLTLFTTPYLKHALYVTYKDDGTLRKEKISYSPNGPSFYWGYSIVLSVSLLPLVFFLFFRRNNGWFVFGHYAILIVTTPWLIYFLVQHPSIIHIVTFDLL